jgi:hypothetical protein
MSKSIDNNTLVFNKDRNSALAIKEEELRAKIIRIIDDADIRDLYDKLPDNKKAMFDDMSVQEKYTALNKMLNRKSASLKTDEVIEEKEYKDEDEYGEDENDDKNDDKKDNNKNAEQTRNADNGKLLDKLMKTYMDQHPYLQPDLHELEVRFNTARNARRLTRNDYDNVIKVMKGLGFAVNDTAGTSYLRIFSEYMDSVSGKYKISNVRVELAGIYVIQDYCMSNDLKSVYNKYPNSVHFVNKAKPSGIENATVHFDNFQFRVSYNTENQATQGMKTHIMSQWKTNKKKFRYINRLTFTHPNYPFKVDLSIVKESHQTKTKGRIDTLMAYTTSEAGVFTNPESYEIELELDNTLIGPTTEHFNTFEKITFNMKQCIKIILGALQGTTFPISYYEINDIKRDYASLLKLDYPSFIGPSPITLQMDNIVDSSDCNCPNIRNNFVVTDKADGLRHMLYIHSDGKIYLINQNMDVIFTGAKTKTNECKNSLLDGELISHNKEKIFINRYASFDLYVLNGRDVRSLPLVSREKEECRYTLLRKMINQLNPVSILTTTEPTKREKVSPITIVYKLFYPTSIDVDNPTMNIFRGCRELMGKINEGLIDYETDGLIFTHMYYGVGGTKEGEIGTKRTWDYAFKWKPPKYNTIDFLITTLKEEESKQEKISVMYQEGISTNNLNNNVEYKTIILRCGFSNKRDIFSNPMQAIIDGQLPKKTEDGEDDYLPHQFYPTEPYDPNAGITNIVLRYDSNGAKQMYTEEGEVFYDNTIVEFSYDLSREEGWRWVPLRVRYDKTSEFQRGMKQYGNAYKTANENWKSIHFPITVEMICTGQGIPDISSNNDMYYNTTVGDEYKTEGLKNFHNLYVKKRLICGVCEKGDTLIDFACGKGGDLPKWVSAKLQFVFGVDYSRDNIEHRLDGACARYLKLCAKQKSIPEVLFVQGNSSENIRSGTAMMSDKAKEITRAVFGTGTKDPKSIGEGVAKQYGIGMHGFNVSSCQFAIHYFFKSPETVQNFMKNVAECTKLNGYFIATTYDGATVFNRLKETAMGDSFQVIEDGKKILDIVKQYNAEMFDATSSSIGYQINVFQESINQYIPEYLVNYDYVVRLMELYGFIPLETEECERMGFLQSSDLFMNLYQQMMNEIRDNKRYKGEYGKAPDMSFGEKQISFLNRYFIFKKIREVNVDKVVLDMTEFNDRPQINQPPTEILVKSIRKMRIRKWDGKTIVLKEVMEELTAKRKEMEIKQAENEEKPDGETTETMETKKEKAETKEEAKEEKADEREKPNETKEVKKKRTAKKVKSELSADEPKSEPKKKASVKKKDATTVIEEETVPIDVNKTNGENQTDGVLEETKIESKETKEVKETKETKKKKNTTPKRSKKALT